MSLVTVVMAHAGGASFLEQALRSLSQQTLEGFRIILVDDAAEVELAPICARFDNLDISVLKNPTRLGLACSLNRGLRACETQFVARMDSDDLSSPGRLASQLNWLSRRPDIAVLGTAVSYIDAAGRYLSRTFPITEPEDMRLAFLAYNQLAHGSIMARTEALLEAGAYDETLQVSQDYDLWLRLSLRGHRIANLAEPYYCQRIHATSASALRRSPQIAVARGIKERVGAERTCGELVAFFSNQRHRALGRPHERLQLGKLGLFVGHLASRADVPLTLRGRGLAFAAANAAGALAVLRGEAAWRREWGRWLRLALP